MSYVGFIQEILEELSVPYPISLSIEKSPRELVTQTDKDIEQEIRQKIQSRYPTHGIRGEEQANVREESDYQWVIDPIDGTTNYVHQIPLFCTAIALLYRNTVVAAGVKAHITNNIYIAEKGKGATKNRQPIHAKRQLLKEGMVGFCHANMPEAIEYMHSLYKTYKLATRDFRRLGSANLELCMLADANLVAFIGYEIQPWDFLPGCLIAAEAGCTITGWNGESWQDPATRSIKATAPGIELP